MRPIIAGLCAASVLLLSTPSAMAESAVPVKRPGCFFARDFESWKAPDARTIYIRVRMHDYYRLDLASSCPALLWPSSHLITVFHGFDTVCSALDWDLKVNPGTGGFPVPCIVKTMTALTPDEVAAIPKKYKP
jgi:hypothetical protein